MKYGLLTVFIIVFVGGANAQTDTTQRDFGVSIGWRSLVSNYPETAASADIVRNLAFTGEVRWQKFWIETGFMLGWGRRQRFKDEYNIDVWIAMPYEFSVFKDRLKIGVGPISSFYHFYSKNSDGLAFGQQTKTNSISAGVDLEIIVPIYKGIALSTCSDIGVQARFSNNQTSFAPRIVRLVSFDIRYRF